MIGSPTRRRLLLSAALAATLLATLYIGEGSSGADTVAVASSATAPASMSSKPSDVSGGTPALAVLDVHKLVRQQRHPNPTPDIFAATSWHAAPPTPHFALPSAPPLSPPPSENVAPPPPVAPPVPFTYLGRLRSPEGRWRYFITRDNRVYVVGEGEVVDELYRIGSVGNGVMELTYLPLNIKQTLVIGDRS